MPINPVPWVCTTWFRGRMARGVAFNLIILWRGKVIFLFLVVMYSGAVAPMTNLPSIWRKQGLKICFDLKRASDVPPLWISFFMPLTILRSCHQLMWCNSDDVMFVFPMPFQRLFPLVAFQEYAQSNSYTLTVITVAGCLFAAPPFEHNVYWSTDLLWPPSWSLWARVVQNIFFFLLEVLSFC